MNQGYHQQKKLGKFKIFTKLPLLKLFPPSLVYKKFKVINHIAITRHGSALFKFFPPQKHVCFATFGLSFIFYNKRNSFWCGNQIRE